MQTTRTFQDRYGLPLSTGSARAVDHYSEGIDRLLSASAGAEESLAAALEADPGFALAQAALAATLQARGRPEEAKQRAERARSLTAGVTRREQRHVEAVALVIAGEGGRALALIREQLAEFPRDALLVLQAMSIFQFGGFQERQQERYAFLAELAPAYGDDWYFLTASSFAHHELDQFDEARRLSERSLALYPRNANATHNLGHVFYETNDHSGGAGFLDGWIGGYERGAPLHCHLSWHLALFELASGHYQRVMEIYDLSISPAVSQARGTLTDSASLLWRYQLYGCARAPLPWEAVRDLASRITARPGVAFMDAHAALAYAAAGDETALTGLIDGLRALEKKGHPLAGSVTLPLVQGIGAFARGEYEATIRLLEPVAEGVVRIGGSNAQREVFEETLLEAYLRAGRCEQAEVLLRRRLDRRPSARDEFWLGRAQSAGGQTETAAQHFREAQQHWQGADPDSPELAALARTL